MFYFCSGMQEKNIKPRSDPEEPNFPDADSACTFYWEYFLSV